MFSNIGYFENPLKNYLACRPIKNIFYNNLFLFNKMFISNATDLPKIKKQSQIKNNMNNEISKYLITKTNYQYLLKTLPSKLYKSRKSNLEFCYIVDENTSKTIISLISKDLKAHDSQIIEVNPGPGILTKELMKIGISNLLLFETSDIFIKHLEKFLGKQKVIIRKLDFFQLSKITYQDKVTNSKKLEDLFQGIEKRKWKDDPVMKIIGFLPNHNFLNHILYSLQFNIGFISYGRSEFYFIMTPLTYKMVTAKQEDGSLLYRPLPILLNTFYDHTLISKLPRKDFVPWTKTKSIKIRTKFKKIRKMDEDFVYLIKFTPKIDIFSQFEDLQMVSHFCYFVRFYYRKSRTSRLIPELEKSIPGIGTRLIHVGYTIFTQFGELNIDEIIKVFKLFYNSPEYSESPFISSLETSYLNNETTNEMLDIDFEIEDENEEENGELQ